MVALEDGLLQRQAAGPVPHAAAPPYKTVGDPPTALRPASRSSTYRAAHWDEVEVAEFALQSGSATFQIGGVQCPAQTHHIYLQIPIRCRSVAQSGTITSQRWKG